MITPGLHHVGLVSADADRSRAFYGDVLGLTVVAADATSGAPLVLGDADGSPGTLVSILESRGEQHGRPGIGGLHHTAFGVGNDDALLKWKRRLVDLDLAVSGPYDRGYFTSIYLRDPDGQILEIATAGPGYATDEPADALGGELVLPPQRIVRGHRDEALIAALTHAEPVPAITPDMELQGIHHVSGITDDLARAGEFYERALGLQLIKRTTNRDDPQQLHYFWANYRDGQVAPHSSFTLFGWPAEWNRARPGIGQTHHVAFQAGAAHELGAWRDHLRSLGITISESAGTERRIRFEAPDGLLLELAAAA